MNTELIITIVVVVVNIYFCLTNQLKIFTTVRLVIKQALIINMKNYSWTQSYKIIFALNN